MRHPAAAALVFFALAGANAQAGEVRPVVVELYTSQSCRSCPPADALLGKLAMRKGIVALSFPITYWDMFGWKDTLASAANTHRQKAYAAAMGRGGVYTPQIIVDGTRDVVGSRRTAVEDAIEAAVKARAAAYDEEDGTEVSLPAGLTSVTAVRRRHAEDGAWSVAVRLKSAGRQLHVAIGRAPQMADHGKIDATIWLFRVRSSATVHIKGGENAGRTLTYRNVVNDISDVGHWRGRAMTLNLKRAGGKVPVHDGVAVIVQQDGYGRVLGAAYLGQSTYYAQQ